MTTNISRKSLKIRICGPAYPEEIDVKESDQWNECQLLSDISHLIKCLESENIDDFMFILELINPCKLKVDQGKIIAALTSASSNVHMETKKYSHLYVVSNANCRICGYAESWSMKNLYSNFF